MDVETVKYFSQHSNVIFYTVCLILFVVYIFGNLFSKNKKLPPGPICLPIVGYLPFIRKDPHLKFWELSKKYGNIFGLYLGNQYVVVLNDFSSIKEAFGKMEFLGRPTVTTFEIAELDKSIVSISGKEWEEQRRFILQQLRDLGFGKSKMEFFIQEEIRYFIKKIEEYDGKEFSAKTIITPSVSNIISAFVFGRRMDYDNPDRKFLDKAIIRITRFFSQTAIHAFMPWLSSILKISSSGYREVNDISHKVNDFVKKEIKDHEESLDASNIRDFIDGFLLQMKKDKMKDVKTSFDDALLLGNIRTLFSAGSETVKTTLEWAFIIMAKYPQVQKKVQTEIDENVNKNEICWTDRVKLPYTRATLTEIQRWRTTVPMNIMRCTLANASLQGFEIPKGTSIAANFWAVHNDPEYWKNPEKFISERFLTEDQKDVSISECFIPFSTGKRSCPGSILANVELLLYFASTLQNYDIAFPEGGTHNLEGLLGVSYQPLDGKLCFTKRK